MAYDTVASEDSIQKTVAAFPARGFIGHVVNTKEEALEKVRSLIPDGSELMTGSSVTLEQIGFTDLLKSGGHPWKNLKDAIIAEQDPARQLMLRKQAVLAPYFLTSVHAIVEDGRTVTASGSGSQVPSLVFTSENVIWVAGAQKIVPSLEEGIRRVREYVWPLEDARIRATGGSGSTLGKLLIFEKEKNPARKIHLILVREALGF